MTSSGTKRIALTGTSLLAAMLFTAGPAGAQASDAPPPESAGNPSAETPLPQSGTDSAADDTQSDTEIVVTGTSIRGVPPTGSNLISVTREEIRAIGANTTPALLAAVPQLNSFNTSPRAAGGGPGAFAPGLRSLPASATLRRPMASISAEKC